MLGGLKNYMRVMTHLIQDIDLFVLFNSSSVIICYFNGRCVFVIVRRMEIWPCAIDHGPDKAMYYSPSRRVCRFHLQLVHHMDLVPGEKFPVKLLEGEKLQSFSLHFLLLLY